MEYIPVQLMTVTRPQNYHDITREVMRCMRIFVHWSINPAYWTYFNQLPGEHSSI